MRDHSRLRLSFVSLAAAAALPSCAQLQLMAETAVSDTADKATKPREKSEEEQRWDEVLADKAKLADVTEPTDTETFKSSHALLHSCIAQTEVYLEYECTAEPEGGGWPGQTQPFTPIGTLDGKHCEEARSLLTEVEASRRELLEAAMKVSAVSFEALDTAVLASQYSLKLATETHDISPWMDDLGKRKSTHWTSELKGHGSSLVGVNDAKGEGACVAYTQDPKAQDLKHIGFAFQPSSTVWVKCAFDQPPATMKRDATDFWRVRSTGGLFTEMTIKVPNPSTTRNATVSFPVAQLAERLKANAAERKADLIADWVPVEIALIKSVITGQEWKDDSRGARWEDKWSEAMLGHATVYVKWR